MTENNDNVNYPRLSDRWSNEQTLTPGCTRHTFQFYRSHHPRKWRPRAPSVGHQMKGCSRWPAVLLSLLGKRHQVSHCNDQRRTCCWSHHIFGELSYKLFGLQLALPPRAFVWVSLAHNVLFLPQPVDRQSHYYAILERFRIMFTTNGENDHVTTITIHLPLAVFRF